MRNHATLKSAMLLVLAAAVGTACDKAKVVVSETTVQFVFPADGEELGPDDDVNGTEPGIQVNVEVAVQDMDDGDRLVLTNSVDLDSTGAPVETVATVAGDTVRFPGYTVPPATVGLTRLRVSTPDVGASDECRASKCAEVSVSVVISDCQFNSPRDGDTLTTDQYPDTTGAMFDPFETDVVVDCRGSAPGDDVILTVNAGLPETATLDSAGRATFPQVVLEEGPNALGATPQTATGPGATASAAVTVSTGDCIARLGPIDGSTILARDDDNRDPADGMQAVLSLVTDCADTPEPTLQLWVKGPADADYVEVTLAGPFATAVDPVGTRFELGAIDLPESVAQFDVEVVGRVTEAAGSRSGTSIPTHYWVDSSPPSIISASPGDGGCVGPLQDLYDQVAGIQIDAFGIVAGVANGAEVWGHAYTDSVPETACALDSECTAPMLCRDDVCRTVGTATSSNFVLSQIEMPVGEATLEYVAQDLAGNQAVVLATIDVLGTAPDLSITAPTNGATLGLADDMDIALPGLQTEVTVALTDVPFGAVGQLLISGQPPVTFLPSAGATATSVVPVALTDGSHTIRAQIQDPCGNDVESAEITVTVFSDVQDLAVVGYAADNAACAGNTTEPTCTGAPGCMWNATAGQTDCVAAFGARTPVIDSSTVGGALVRIDLDIVTGLGSSGADRTLSVSRWTAVDMSGSVRACSGTETTVSPLTVPWTETGVLLTDLDLVAGVNCFSISAVDAINTLIATFVVTQKGDMPTLTVDPPGSPLTWATLDAAADDSDSDGTNGFNFPVGITLSGGGGTGGAHDVEATLELQIGDDAGTFTVYDSIELPLAANTAAASFADASLPTGSYDLRAVLTDLYGNAATSAVQAVVVSSTGPQIVITAPRGGEAIGTDVDGTTSGVQFVVTVADLGGSAVTSCDLIIDGAAGGTGGIGDITSTVADLAEGAHDVRVECVDAGANTGISQTVTIEIDTVAPPQPILANEPVGTPGRLVFDAPGIAYVNSFVTDSSAQPGLQHRVGILVQPGGADPVGWVIALTVTPPSPASPTIYSHTVTAPDDPIFVSFDGVDFGGGLEGEQIDFSVVVTDRAGNESSADIATLDIDRVAPVLTQTNPDPLQLSLNRADDENVDPTYVDVSFAYTVTGATGDLELDLSPVPSNLTAGDFPLTVASGGGTLTFQRAAFADGRYTAMGRAYDVAGNVAEIQYTFDVSGLDARITWAIPSAPGLLNVARDTAPTTTGFQGTFAFNATGFVSGTEFRLCSNVQPTGVTATCKWGSDGIEGGTDAGWVVGTGFLSGSVSASSVFLSNLFLEEGAQKLHGEATEADSDPDIYSEFFDFTVDSTPPVIETITLDDNDTGNDPATYLLLGGAEGTPSGGRLNTSVTVTASGSETGRTVQLLSTRPSAGSVVGTATLNGSQQATFNVALVEGVQTLSARVTDASNNPSTPATDTVAGVDVAVDVTPGSVSVPGAEYAPGPYTSVHGAVVGNNLEIDITVSVSDNESLEGATVRLDQFAASTGGTARQTDSQTLVAGQNQVTFSGFGLDQGLNYMAATFTDAAGNVAPTVTRELYPADFLGPDLTLTVEDSNGVGLTCAAGTPCLVDYEDPVPNAYRAVLDETGSDGFITSPDGTTMLFSLTDCDNSDPSIEQCSASSRITVRLESRLTTGGPAFLPLLGGTYQEEADVAAGTAFSSKTSYALDAGTVREVRLTAVDLNGNVSHSPSVFLQLDLDGVLVTVERLDAAVQPTGEILDDGLYWGVAENVASGGIFETNLKVTVTELGTLGVSPTDVDLQVNTGAAANQALTAGESDYLGVGLETSPRPTATVRTANTITVTVNCGAGNPCGGAVYQDIIADIEPPTYEFNRCDLCALAVPLVNDTLCGTCDSVAGNAQANILDTGEAEWNAAGDQDDNPSNGFSILASGTPLRVEIDGLEDGEIVRLESNRGGLTGASVLSTGCEPPSDCRATFGALNVPTLSGNLVHDITVSVTDRAGNAAMPAVGRAPETIHAKTDVLAPAGVQATVCIGESTTPASVSPPESDPKTYEDPSCAAACAAPGAECDRRGGKATLTWLAPTEDGPVGGDVEGYDVLVAAIGIPYPDDTGSSIADCASLDPEGDLEQAVAVATAAAPGELESATIADLFPHRSYCFAVLAVDDVGNRAVASVTERALPLTTYPDIAVFDPINQVDDDPDGTLYADPDSGLSFGVPMAAIGDMDGDGATDFAAARANYVDPIPRTGVRVFLSSQDLTVPTVLIEAPADSAPTGGFFGATSIAGGDFDGDGLADLAICSFFLDTVGGTSSGPAGGALYLYYGCNTEPASRCPGPAGSTGLRRDLNTTDTSLPSPFPDVALFGPAGANFCTQALLANLDNQLGDELVVSGLGNPRVFGFRGGSRDRFPSSPPATAKVYLDLASDAVDGFTQIPNFSIQRKMTDFGTFPTWMTAADVDGDGFWDLAVSDHQATHAACDQCGEVYVFDGASGIAGVIGPPDTSPPQLATTLQSTSSRSNFGQTLGVLPQPMAASGDNADWLLVQSTVGGQHVTVFQAVTGSGITGVSHELDRETWTGTPASSFGWVLAPLGEFDGHGGVDLLVGPIMDFSGSPAFIYSFDPTTQRLVKRVVLQGGTTFGVGAAGLSGYLDPADGGATQLVISSPGIDSVFLFR